MDTVNEKIFRTLKGFGYSVAIFDEDGLETMNPEKGVRFYVSDPNLMVTMDSDDAEIQLSISSIVDYSEVSKLANQLKRMAAENMLSYTLKTFGKKITPKDFSYQVKDRDTMESIENKLEKLCESLLSKLYGRMKTSYQTLGEVKIIYKHRVPVNENVPSSRTRNIKSITLEYNGERFAYPCVHVDGARALARHLNEGGLVGDLAGQYIIETSMKFKKLVEFAKYAKKNKLISEDNDKTFSLVETRIKQLKEQFRKFFNTKDYKSVCEEFEQKRLDELNDERVNELKDSFTVKYFDTQLEEVLPLINNILKEKEDYEAALTEEVSKDVYITDMPIINSALQFETKNAELAYFLGETSKFIENQTISKFFRGLSEKLASGSDLDVFEIETMKEAIHKMTSKKSVKKSQPISDPMDQIQELADNSNPFKLLSENEMSDEIYKDIARIVAQTVPNYIPDSDGFEAVYRKVAKIIPMSERDNISHIIHEAVRRYLGSQDYYTYVHELIDELVPKMDEQKEMCETEHDEETSDFISKFGDEFFKKLADKIRETVSENIPDGDGFDDIVKWVMSMSPVTFEYDYMSTGTLIDEATRRYLNAEDFNEYVQNMVDSLDSESSRGMGEASEMYENEDEHEIFDQGQIVLFKKESPYHSDGIFKVSYNALGAKESKPWIGDSDGRGWYVYASELEVFDPDNDRHLMILARQDEDTIKMVYDFYGNEIVDFLEDEGLYPFSDGEDEDEDDL